MNSSEINEAITDRMIKGESYRGVNVWMLALTAQPVGVAGAGWAFLETAVVLGELADLGPL
jgi:hypothetical protein